MNNKILLATRCIALLGAVALAIYVALQPDVVYKSTPRAVLFLLVACIPAILFASEATAKLQMKLPGLVITAGGAAAMIYIALLLLDSIARPEQYIAVYQVYDANHQPVQGLNREGALEVLPSVGGLPVSYYVDSNAIVVIFPEQVLEVTLLIRPVLSGPSYRRTIRYDGESERLIILNGNET